MTGTARARRILPNTGEEPKPVEHGHHDVGQHQIRRVRAHVVERGAAIGNGVDVVVRRSRRVR